MEMERNDVRVLPPREGDDRRSPRAAGRLQLYPARELKCLWMLAGVLTYRLCARSHECDSCPLDRALRGGPAGA